MTAAYVFVQLTGSNLNPQKVHSDVHAVRGVKTVHLVAGPVDMIVFVEVSDAASLTDAIMGIRGVDGVASTDTRLVFPI